MRPKAIQNLGPGYYAIGLRDSPAYVNVEIDGDGNIHQLNREGERDGILDDDGWDPNAICLGQWFK